MKNKNKEGITVKKTDNFSEWYTQIIQKAELADIRFGIQGFIVHRPWGFKIIRKIYEYLEEAVEKQGHEPFLFPIAVKHGDLMKEKEHAGFNPEVFWVEKAGSKKIEEKFALRPTGEAQIYPMYSLWFRSHNDLPFLGYQDRISVFRNEMTTRPFLRGREFLFFETHDVFNTHKESLKQIDKDLETCEKIIYDKIKIPFLYFKRPEWDKFKGADATFTPDTLMPDGKRNQLASTHDLGQNFSKAYNIKVINKNEKKDYVWQTCFGPGIWRIIAALISIHGDDNGLIIPFDMAPVQAVVIPILKKGKEKEILEFSKKVKRNIKCKVKLDDSKDYSPGYKYNHWELFGVPLRIEIGLNELKKKSVTLVRRTDGEKISVAFKNLNKEIKKQAELIDNQIKEKADKYFINNSREAKMLTELKRIISKDKGFVKVPFCSIKKDGEKCANILKSETKGGNVCGTLYPTEEKVKKGQKCIICGKEAKHIVYVAKSY